ncbi:MAG: UDP-N-acetylglucosamine 2-epimerase (non-hydrolyzing) [Elusimicrobia bacterium]|nr:UDP-N-acetylglucosamine 2-epimerase (non-hydrolyzing) [Elusimicrobiota bacterium]
MKWLSVVGTRPQFVKAAMVVAAIRRRNRALPPGRRIRHALLHTGQHYDPRLSDVFFRELPLPKPAHNLRVGSGSHGEQTARMLAGIESVLLKKRPDVVIVYGDTNSSLAGTLAAAKLGIRVVHVEAGLRSFNPLMAEEVNRVVADRLSSLLFCPTRTAVRNLAREGMRRGVFLTGDVMLDAVATFAGDAARRSRVLRRLGLRPGRYILATIHRAENTDDTGRLARIADGLLSLEGPVVLPMHPRLRHRLSRLPVWRRMRSEPRLLLTAPVSYRDMLCLEASAHVIMTDSGGVQREAYFLGVPCLTVRGETEWPETFTHGWNRVVGVSAQEVRRGIERLLADGRPRPRPILSDFGGGRASDRVVRIMEEHARFK